MYRFSSEYFKKIEFDKVRELLVDKCLSPLASFYFHDLEPFTDLGVIKTLLKEVVEYRHAEEIHESIPLRPYESVEDDIPLLKKDGFVLEISSIRRIYHLVSGGNDILEYFQEAQIETLPNIYNIVRELEIDQQLCKEIDRVLDDQGNVKPNASPRLQKVSRMIQNKERELDKVFAQELAFYQAKGFLSDTKESLRNGRRVFTVNAEYKRQIEGLIHDESATGKTVFIESAPLISINNEIFNLYTERKKEVYKILKDLCKFLRPHADLFLELQNIHVKLDTIRAKMILAKEMNAKRPKIGKRVKFKFNEAYNPLLFLKNERTGDRTVPFDLELYGKNKVVVLSGPNAGGKSITLKSVALLQVMLQSGLLIPVSEDSEFGVFHNFFADIGDQQSLEDDLSTYSSHLKNMKDILDNADHRSLIVIDEFGSGTDPKIGGAIAESILKEIVEKRSFCVVTTHYSNLKFFAYKTKGVINASMEFDQEEFQPTYSLIVGKPGSSFAFEIAQKSGLPPHVLKYARKRTGKEELALDQILVSLQSERQEIELKMADVLSKEDKLDQLIRTYDALHREVEYNRKQLKLERQQSRLELSQEKKKQTKELINRFKNIKNSEQIERIRNEAKEEEKDITSQLNNIKEEIFLEDQKTGNLDFQVGSRVRMRGGNGEGIILQLDKSKAEIEMGMMKIWVPIIELLPVEESKIQRKSTNIRRHIPVDSDFETKLDIRGYSMQEAAEFLEKFLDDALINDAYELTIIHGVGSGVLKKLVNQKTKEYKDIKRKWHPEPDQGGEGVTMIQL